MDLDAALKRHFGYDAFLPGQRELVAATVAGRDVFALMPTGAGKSLIYQLAALERPGVGIVISPLIALMQDQVERLQANGIAATFINSALSPDEQRGREQEAIHSDTKLIYLAPERLMMPRTLAWLAELHNARGIALLAVDEAHCISEWGHEFRPEYRQISTVRDRLADVPVLALTATATQRVQSDIVHQLHLRDPFVHIASFNRPNLHYAVRAKGHRSYGELTHLLRQHRGAATIIYCLSRKRVEQLAEKLRHDGIAALPYHAGMPAEDRAANQRRFMRDDTPVLVATVAFGMGIAKPDVRMVIHYEMPRTLEGYYQESGRAGRDGLPAQCIIFYSRGDRFTIEHLIKDQESADQRAMELRQFQAAVRYMESRECRRRTLLAYFGETMPDAPCGNCDVCTAAPVEMTDRTTDAQKLLSCIGRTGERFGMTHIIAVLRGASQQRLRDLGHDRLPTYGVGRDRSEQDWRDLCAELLRQGILREDSGEYPVLRLTPLAWEVLRGARNVLAPAAVPEAAIPHPTGNTVTDPLDADSFAIFEHLRALRKELADAGQVPPFVIFSDAVLRQMARMRPSTPELLLRLSGVGERKRDQYGAPFLAALHAICEERNLPQDCFPAEALAPATPVTRSVSPTHVQSYELFQGGATIPEIAAQRRITTGTVFGHLIQCMHSGLPVALDRVVTPERQRAIIAAFAQTGSERLAPVKDLLGEDYSWDEIRIMKAAIEAHPEEFLAG
jgi:ATP-dependent DNA helicase RecQ